MAQAELMEAPGCWSLGLRVAKATQARPAARLKQAVAVFQHLAEVREYRQIPARPRVPTQQLAQGAAVAAVAPAPAAAAAGLANM